MSPPQPRSPSPYYASNAATNQSSSYNYNQSSRRTSSPIGWSSAPTATQGGAAYPQGGRPPQSSGLHRSDTGAYQNTLRPQGNSTPSMIVQDECRAWFMAIDQNNDGSLSADELRSALLNNGGLRFSASTVKYLMSIFDSDGNGVITYEEFEPLWIYMIEWRQMFDSFDQDGDGRIDSEELGRALAHYHLRVGPHILDMLVRKYGIVAPPRSRVSYGQPYGHPRPQMDLDSFVCASVIVRQMCDLYERCKGGGRSQISRDDFLQSVIALP